MADAKVEETATASPSPPDEQKQVSFKVVQGKNAYSIEMPESSTVSDLKTKLEGLTGVHANMQKLLWRGL